MHSIVIAANAVLPVAFMMLLGALLKNRNIIREASFKDFNWVVFHICLPVTLFNNIQGMDPAMLSDPGIVLFAFAAVVAAAVVSMLLMSRVSISDRQRGVVVQAIFRSNFVILGLPIIESIYGPGNTGSVPLLIAFVVPTFNILSVLILQHYSDIK